ncbi:MAG: MMPL family transporter [Gemmatimonadota bacterium]
MRLSYERIVHYVYHHHLSIILVCALLSLGAGCFAARLRIKADSADLLPDDYVSVRELNRIKERVGGIGPLMIIITGDDLEKCVQFMQVLADSLDQSDLISSVIRGRNYEFLSHNRLLYMGLADLEEIELRVEDHIDLQKAKQSPLYVGLDEEGEDDLDFRDLQEKYRSYEVTGLERDYYLTEEGNGIILRLYPSGVITDVKFTNRLLAYLDHTIAAIGPERLDPSIACDYQGSFKNASYQYGVVVKDLTSTALYAFLGVFVLISLYFRQTLSPLFIMIPLLMSLSWTFGLTYLVIGNLNQITVCLFAILFGLGIDFGIHIFARYREARRRGMATEQALVETVCHTGSALTITAITTAVAFFSLLFSDFKGFSEFGFIVGTGIMFSLVAMLVACPAFIVLAERFHLIRLQQKSVPEHLLRRGRYPVPVLTIAIGLLATAFSLYHLVRFEHRADGWHLATDLEFEYDFRELRPETPETGPKASLPEELKEERSPAIVLTENREAAMEVVAAVEAIRAARGDSSTIRSVKSVYSALPEDQDEKLAVIGRIRDLVDDSRDLLDLDQSRRADSLRQYLDVRPLQLEDLPGDMSKSFSSKDGEILSFVMITAAVPLRDGRNAIAFAREIKEIHTASGRVYHASSAHIIFAEMLQLMLDDAVKAVVLTLLVVTIVLYIDLRSVAETAIVLTPLLSALVWVTGFMYLLDFRINIYNMVAFPTIIGMGIDNAVHVYHRYREAGRGSLRLVLRTTGVALLATTLTTMVGFAGLIPAHHPALYWIGTVSLIGLGSCFVAAMTLLPAMLQMREALTEAES